MPSTVLNGQDDTSEPRPSGQAQRDLDRVEAKLDALIETLKDQGIAVGDGRRRWSWRA